MVNYLNDGHTKLGMPMTATGFHISCLTQVSSARDRTKDRKETLTRVNVIAAQGYERIRTDENESIACYGARDRKQGASLTEHQG